MHIPPTTTHLINQHITDIIDSAMEFNNIFAQASNSLLQNSFLVHKQIINIRTALPEKMAVIIKNCSKLLEICQESCADISLSAFTGMLQYMLGNMNNWLPTRRLGVKFEKNGDFLFLAKLIKKIIKKVLNYQKQSSITINLENTLNSLNNYIADYYLEKGSFHDAEAYFSRSINAHMEDSDSLQIHAQLVQLKATALRRISHEQEAEQLLAIIIHNLNEINKALKADKLDDSCVSTVFIIKLCNFLTKTQEALTEKLGIKTINNFNTLRVTHKLIYEIYLRLNVFRKGARFKQHISENSDSALILVFAKSQQKIDMGLKASFNIITSLAEIANKLPVVASSAKISPSVKQKNKKKAAVSLIKPKLVNKSEASKKIKPALNKENECPLKSKTPLDKNSPHTGSSVTIVQAKTTFFKQLKSAKQQQSSKLSQNETTKTVVEIDKLKPVDLNESSRQDSSSFKSINKQQQIELKPSLKFATVLYAITSRYLPPNSLAGILPNCIETLISKNMAIKFTEVIARGKVIGNKGKGIKLVTYEECLKRGLESCYIYKLKDPGLDERIYGREVTAKELQQIGISNQNFKKIIIFDLFVNSHKLQAKHIKLVIEETHHLSPSFK